MLTPDTPASNMTAAAGTGMLSVAADTLAVDGVMPAVGDELEVTVQARVAAVDGDAIRLEPMMVNGAPLMAMAPAAEADDDEAMMAMAKEADSAGGMGY